MDSIYKGKSAALIDMCGKNAKMSFIGAATIFMNIAELHEDHLGNGIVSMNKRGMHWVMAKAEYRLINPQDIFTEKDVKTWCINPKNFRSERDFVIGDINDANVIGRVDWAIVGDDGKRKKVKDELPDGFEYQDIDLFKGRDWPRVERDFNNSKVLGTYTVKSTDIDFIGHMNNVAYVRAALGFFTADEILKYNNLYIQYLSSCFEGEKITFKLNDFGEFKDICMEKDGEPCAYIRISNA